jgi:hypothetical protein
MNLVWATRGRVWGFRFLLDGGFGDPLPVYDSAFSGTEGESAVYRRIASRVALRFPDPLGRRDEAGRVIPHDFVVLPPLADEVRSVDEGILVVWPLVADFYADVWDEMQPPSGPSVRAALGLEVDPPAVRGLRPPLDSDSENGVAHKISRLTDPPLLGLAIVGVGSTALAAWVVRRAIRRRGHQQPSTV